MSVLAILEQRAGKYNRLSFESLSAAQKLAAETHQPVAAVVLGSGVGPLAEEAARYAVSEVLLIDDPGLAQYTPEGYVIALEALIEQQQPAFVVFPHTYQVRDYAPKMAARLGHSLLSDVVGIRNDGDSVFFIRQFFQGKLNAEIPAHPPLQCISIQAGSFPAAAPVDTVATVAPFKPAIDPAAIRSRPEEPFQETRRSVDLGAAALIVSVGRGIKEQENLHVAEELAQALGAELAASRPICDNGWLPMERQVGSSGQTVAPKIYFALGISGAIQHLVGMKGAKTIVAINKDETAPIFETADYGIAADLFDVVPAITEEIKKAKS